MGTRYSDDGVAIVHALVYHHPTDTSSVTPTCGMPGGLHSAVTQLHGRDCGGTRLRLPVRVLTVSLLAPCGIHRAQQRTAAPPRGALVHDDLQQELWLLLELLKPA